MNFWKALEILKNGWRVSRENWNGKWLFLTLQIPTKLSKMTKPYIYITIPAGSLGYEKEELMPWLPSQTDLLWDDWLEV